MVYGSVGLRSCWFGVAVCVLLFGLRWVFGLRLVSLELHRIGCDSGGFGCLWWVFVVCVYCWVLVLDFVVRADLVVWVNNFWLVLYVMLRGSGWSCGLWWVWLLVVWYLRFVGLVAWCWG